MLQITWHIPQTRIDDFTEKIFDLGLSAVSHTPFDPKPTDISRITVILAPEDWNRVQAYMPPPTSIEVSGADWLNAWCQDLRPVTIDDIVIQPLAFDEPSGTVKGTSPITLMIDPRDSFGYGTHPSTNLCLQLLSAHRALIQGKRILDVGTGSGVLALTALKLGAGSAYGIDNDPAAVESAARNAALNQIGNAEFALEGLETPEEKFDVIIANVPLETLEQLLPEILEQTTNGTVFFLSGFLESERGRVEKLFPTRPRKEFRSASDDSEEWGAIAIFAT